MTGTRVTIVAMALGALAALGCARKVVPIPAEGAVQGC